MTTSSPIEATQLPPAAPRRALRRRLVLAASLFLLAPLVGEFLLGNISIDQIGAVVLLAPMYGGGALLVREAARRAGRGWSTIAVLAVAYGLIEEGIIDQMLFNPSYYGLDTLSTAYVPGLGIGASVTVTVLAMHTVWSIAIPIAMVEALSRDRATEPWLGKVGLTVTGAVFVSGSAGLFYSQLVEEDFLASAGQLASTAVAIVALVIAAFRLGRRHRPPIDRPAPRPWLVGSVLLVLSSAFFLLPEHVPDWIGVGLDLMLVVLAWALVARWSRHQGWSPVHHVAAAGGALLTYGWLGFVQVPLDGSADAVKLVGNTVFAAGAIVLLALAVRSVRRHTAS